MKHTLTISFYLVLIFIVSCQPKIKKEVKSYYPDKFIEATFAPDGRIDGNAKVFTKEGKLVIDMFFVNGRKFGPEIHYSTDGYKTDSFNFVNDLKNGFQYSFDKNGIIEHQIHYYYGILIGDEVFYSDGKPIEYSFTSFNKTNLVDCKYDLNGNLDSLFRFTFSARFSRVKEEGAKRINFFFYMPHLPNTESKFSIGIANIATRRDSIIGVIIGNRPFIDTILPYPDSTFNYFVSAHIKSPDGKINKVFVEEVSTNRPPKGLKVKSIE